MRGYGKGLYRADRFPGPATMSATSGPSERPSPLAAGLEPPERVFTVEEADRLLPDLEAAFRDVDGPFLRLEEVSELVQDLEEYWGGRLADPDLPDRTRYLELVRERDETQGALDRVVGRIQGMGVILKDLQSGLIDLYGTVDGNLVFLCWRRGEPALAFYHALDTGFAGRKALVRAP